MAEVKRLRPGGPVAPIPLYHTPCVQPKANTLSYTLQTPDPEPLFYTTSKAKTQNYLQLALASEFLKVWFVVPAFKCQNFHFQR